MHPKVNDLLKNLSTEGSILLFGGAVRDLGYYKTIPRDLDIVINNNSKLDTILSGIPGRKNRFGGYKIVIGNVSIDIWNLPVTWAFRRGILMEDVTNLTKSVFLNFDAVVYDVTNNKLYDEGFSQAISSKLLDIVLRPNPYPALNVLRTLVFIEKYDFNLSFQLQEYILSWFKVNKLQKVNQLLKLEEMHYGTKLFCEEKINDYLNQILNRNS
jgi:hypothetical protein